MDNRFEVTVGAGTMMAGSGAAARFPHRWTPGGVTVEADFTGGHLLHLAAAGCVLNDLYREAAALGIDLKGVRVIAVGGFDTATWRSTGIDYSVEVSSDAPADRLAHLLEVVDQVAEIPQAIRAGATVRRVGLADSSRPKRWPAPVDAHLAACEYAARRLAQLACPVKPGATAREPRLGYEHAERD